MNAHQRRSFGRMLARFQNGLPVNTTRGTLKHALSQRVERHLLNTSAHMVMIKVAKSIRRVPIAGGRVEIVGGIGPMPASIPIPAIAAKKPPMWRRFTAWVDGLLGHLSSLRGKALATAGAE